ncbi:MAG: HisA/HisF-related TIM barrel protein [Actinomycetota bacterium]
MTFDVLPAIDVARGRLARFGPDGPVTVLEHGGDPVAAAASFVEAGARWLHVVDMDLAYEGVARNIGVIAEIAKLEVPIQASGGVVTEGDVDRLLGSGASRAVLGSGALGDRPLVARVVDTYRERIAVGVEVDDERITPRGRSADSELPLDVTLAFLAGVGAARFVVTSVDRVGTLGGPDLRGLQRVVQATTCPVIAAGGISTRDDLDAVARVPGVEGAIVGRAALEGGLSVAEALAAGAPDVPEHS